MRKVSNFKLKGMLEDQIDVLFHFFAESKNFNEMDALLDTLLTLSEKAAVSQRLAIFRMLQSGSTYSDIRFHLKVPNSTINNVSDLYHKHGSKNKLFNQQLDCFKYQPKKNLPADTSPILPMPLSIGTRSLIRDNRRKNK